AREIGAARAIFGRENGIPEILERISRGRAHQVFIIDNEDGGSSAQVSVRVMRTRRNTFLRGGFFGGGEPDAERAAGAGRSLHVDLSLVAAGDAQRRRKAQAAAGKLGTEKRVEDLGARGLIHAASGVAHFD